MFLSEVKCKNVFFFFTVVHTIPSSESWFAVIVPETKKHMVEPIFRHIWRSMVRICKCNGEKRQTYCHLQCDQFEVQ